MSAIVDSTSWAEQTFGPCQLGDQRRTNRLIQMAQRVIENPSGSLPDQMLDWAELKAAYRLFAADGVTLAAIASPHWKQTCQQAVGRTLVICDTTVLNFGQFRVASGLGPTGEGYGRGFLLHNAIMVDATTRSLIGVAGQTVHYRTSKISDETRMQRLKRRRESEVWGRLIDQIGPPYDTAQHVYVCDRGADNFEVFCHLVQQNSDWIIRGKSKNRKVQTASGKQTTLGELLPMLSLLGTYELSLRARHRQPARTAQIEVSSGTLTMPFPRQKSPWLRSLSPDPITMNVVWVREVDVPDGASPVEWMLLTSLPVDTFEEAWSVIEDYESRWLVEEYHKALKSGTRVTQRQLQTAERLEAIVGLLSVVAVHLVQLKTLARSNPDQKARRIIPLLWLQMLKAARKQIRRAHDLTISEFYREVAKLGGFIGRKSDGDPGWMTIWRGWEKLTTLIQGAKLAKQLYDLSVKCG